MQGIWIAKHRAMVFLKRIKMNVKGQVKVLIS